MKNYNINIGLIKPERQMLQVKYWSDWTSQINEVRY